MPKKRKTKYKIQKTEDLFVISPSAATVNSCLCDSNSSLNTCNFIEPQKKEKRKKVKSKKGEK